MEDRREEDEQPPAKRLKSAAGEDEDDGEDAGEDGDGDVLDIDDGDLDQAHAEPEMMKLLLASMTDEQRDRYEVVRRSRINPREMTRFMRDLGYQPPVKFCRIILGTIAKIFAGELVEEAKDIMKAANEKGPIQPRHLVLAARKLKKAGKIPSTEYTQKRLFL